MSCSNYSSVPGKDEIYLEEQKKSTKEKRNNGDLVEVNNELQTITAQCFTLEDLIKKLAVSFVDMMKKQKKGT